MSIETRLQDLGLTLPPPMKLPAGVVLPFSMIKVVGKRVVISGHLPLNDDGTVWDVRGKVGADVTLEQATEGARRVTLSMLTSLKAGLGSLDRITNWVRVLGMVNTAPGFNNVPPVINGCSNLLIDLFGPEVGSHTRSAVGFSEIAFDCPVEIEAEVEIA